MKDTLAEFLVCPPDKAEVKASIHSEETRILPSSKFLNIVHNIYEYKALNFYWDSGIVVEERAIKMRKKVTKWPLSEQVESKAPSTSSFPCRHDYDYAVADFVALRAGDVDNPLPFWI